MLVLVSSNARRLLAALISDMETSVPVNTLPTDTFAVNKCLLWQHHRRPTQFCSLGWNLGIF